MSFLQFYRKIEKLVSGILTFWYRSGHNTVSVHDRIPHKKWSKVTQKKSFIMFQFKFLINSRIKSFLKELKFFKEMKVFIQTFFRPLSSLVHPQQEVNQTTPIRQQQQQLQQQRQQQNQQQLMSALVKNRI